MWEVIQEQNTYYLAESQKQVEEAMVYGEDEPRDFHRFLNKFNILNKIKWSEELIDRSVRAICNDLIAEGVDYTWMRFTINKYMTHLTWHRKDAIKFVYDAFKRYAPDRVGLVLCLKYEAERAGQRQLASLINDAGAADCLIGLDLVGDEAYYDVDFYKPIFCEWKKAGKKLFAHVGESQSAENIKTAIEQLGVTEINHGIKAHDRDDILEVALDNDVCFHMALTSNELTGVIKDMRDEYVYAVDAIRAPDDWMERTQIWHPVSTMIGRVPVTVGTDDPVQCNTTMDKEYALLVSRYPEHRREHILRTVQETAINRAGK